MFLRFRNNKKRSNIFVIGLVLLLVLVGIVFWQYLTHEKRQSMQIQQIAEEQVKLRQQMEVLQTTNEELNRELSVLRQEIQNVYTNIFCEVDYDEEAYNYLAIGNSILIHEPCDYWWNMIGMAASVPEKDYFSQVTSYLENTFGKVCAYRYNFYRWETQGNDRSETLSLLNPYLNTELDLITVQLGENVMDAGTFRQDYVEMIRYLQEKCPAAQIIIVDDFWSNERSGIIREAAEELELPFVDLAEIRFVDGYSCDLGTTVYDEEGNPHTVEHEGVARHPGDLGMTYYAEHIIANINAQ